MLTAVQEFVRQARDVRKSGRTLSVAVVVALAVNIGDAQIGDNLTEANELVAVLVLTPVAEYAWRKLRTAIGWDEGTP